MEKNPCDKCIVNAMCQEGCNELERYIYMIMIPHSNLSATYFNLSDEVRRGLVSLESIIKTMETGKNDQSM